MTYAELKQIRDSTQLLPYDLRIKGFSEGIVIIQHYLGSDFGNTHIDTSSKIDLNHFDLLYGNVFEVLTEGLSRYMAERLFEIGWRVEDGLSETDNYFKFTL